MSKREMLAVVARHYPNHIVFSASQVGNVWTVTLQHADGGSFKQVKIYYRRKKLYVEIQRTWRSVCQSQ